MADSFVRLPADGAGKQLDTRTAPDGDHREVVVVGSPTLADVAEADVTNGLDVDVTRIIPGTAATNLGKAVDSALGATDTGVSALAVRDDALAALTPADGDYTNLRTDSTGALWVRDTGGAAGGTAMADDAVFTPATTQGTPAFGFADETAPDSVDEGDAGALRMTLDRKLLTRVVGATDANRLDIDGSGHAQVDIAATSVTVPVSIAAALDTELPAAAALADNTANPTVPAVGAFGMIWDGATWDRAKGDSTDGALVNLGANNDVSLNAGTNNIGDVDVLSVIPGTGATNLGKAIDSVAGATDTGVPPLAIRDDALTNLTPVDGDYVPLRTDINGALWVALAGGGGGASAAVDTELPAAAALADNTANPTVPAVGSFLMAFDGTNWDRVQTGAAATGSLKVDGSAVTQPVSGTVTANAGTNLNTSALALESGGNLATAVASLSVLDDWDETDRAKVNIIAGQVGVAGDAGVVGATVQRVVQANGAGKTILSAGGSAASNGNNTLVAAGTNRLKVFAFSLTTLSTTAMTCIFQSGAGGTELWRVVIQAPTSVSAGANLATAIPGWLFATASATLLNLNLSSANAVHWSVSYYDEA